MDDARWMDEADSIMLGHTMMFVCLAGTLIDKGVVTREEMTERLQGMADFATAVKGEGAAEPFEAVADLLSEFTESFSNFREAIDITNSLEVMRNALARRGGGGPRGGHHGGAD